MRLGLPPGWRKITDNGRLRGYRGPAGERAKSIARAWELHGAASVLQGAEPSSSGAPLKREPSDEGGEDDQGTADAA